MSEIVATKPISELPAVPGLAGAELIPVCQDGTAKRLTAQQLKEYAAAEAKQYADSIANVLIDVVPLAAGAEPTVAKSIDKETGYLRLTFGLPESADWTPKITGYERTRLIDEVFVADTAADYPAEAIEAGDSVVIRYDGTERTHQIQDANFFGSDIILYAGNLSMINSTAANTGEPYILTVSPRTKTCGITVQESAIVSAFWMKPIVESHLPEVFLRFNYATLDYVNNAIENLQANYNLDLTNDVSIDLQQDEDQVVDLTHTATMTSHLQALLYAASVGRSVTARVSDGSGGVVSVNLTSAAVGAENGEYRAYFSGACYNHLTNGMDRATLSIEQIDGAYNTTFVYGPSTAGSADPVPVTAYVVSEPLNFTLSADNWSGSNYSLVATGYKTGVNGINIGLPTDSTTVNTKAVIEAALTAPRADVTAPNTSNNTVGYTTITISAVNVPTEDVTIAVFGLEEAVPVMVTQTAIEGIAAPEVDKVLSSKVTECDQFTGVVAWNPSGYRAEAATTYTATITLTPKPGYTFSGVASNSFTVAGATSVRNNASSGVVTAVFPTTAEATA